MLILVRLAIVPGSCRRPRSADRARGEPGELVCKALASLLLWTNRAVGGGEWAMGTLDAIVEGEKDNSQLLQTEKLSCHCVPSDGCF